MLALAVGFTVALASMRVFGPHMVIFWREAAPGVGMGMPKAPYFLAKCAVELPRLALLCLALLSTFYPMASPRCPFFVYFAIFFGAAFAVSGWALLLSIAQDPKSAQLSAVVVVVVFAMFCGVAPRLPELARMGATAMTFARCVRACVRACVHACVRASSACSYLRVPDFTFYCCFPISTSSFNLFF